MFALATTNTRSMKGTAVFRSLKSWASRLHQHLPLSPRESQRLLTALTSSFRKHLDEVHPPPATQEAKLASAGENTAVASARGLHSSAASADKHLASILTNPLLARGSPQASKADQDYANAKILLQKGTKNPISLLEEYAEQGAATGPLARLCLEDFEASISSLSVAKQKAVVAETEPGRRTLLVVWKANLHQTAVFVDDIVLIDLLTNALMRERLESYLWDWLKLDMVLADKWEGLCRNAVKERHHLYRWKGRILRQMARYCLHPPYEGPASMDAALDVYFQAIEIRTGAEGENTGPWMPLHAVGTYLHHTVCDRRSKYGNVDPKRFDRFVRTAVLYLKTGGIGAELQQAMLMMYHPKQPNAHPFVQTLRQLLRPGALEQYPHAFKNIRFTGGTDTETNKWHSQWVYALHKLRLEGAADDADWLREQTRRKFPDHERYTDRDLRELMRTADVDGTPDSEDSSTAEARQRGRVPFPTFT